MELYIQIKDGMPYEHPAVEKNLLETFGQIPEGWEPFVRVSRPYGLYKVFLQSDPTYEKVDGVWTDVWHYREMTAEEKATEIQAYKDHWDSLPNRDNFSAWSFDEATRAYVPPIPKPNDGKNYFWQGTTSLWVELPQYPDDGKKYKLDIASATWVEVTP